jgi:hypothetical protein
MKLFLLFAYCMSSISSFGIVPQKMVRVSTRLAFDTHGGFDTDVPVDEILTQDFMTEIACKAEGLRGRNPEVDDRSLIPPFHLRKANTPHTEDYTMAEPTPVDELLSEAFFSEIDMDAELSALKSGRNDGNMI